MMQDPLVDVLIVGAGLSGIGAAVRLQMSGLAKSYAILEGRAALGGTWDVFRYPGVRSDSDMFTMGYAFKPWRDPATIGDGGAIRDYIAEAAREHGVDQHIHYEHRVLRAAWSSREALWTVSALHGGQEKTFTCRFLLMCAGYFDQEKGYTPAFEGADTFTGQLLHPQSWPRALDYAGKRVVVIGSGASAATIVPAMSEQAAHVVMLQRSPSYYYSMPRSDGLAAALSAWLPARWAYALNRFIRMSLQQIFYFKARFMPGDTRRRLLDRIASFVGDDAVRTHFSPRYQPWRQRVCIVPDSDLFAAIADGKASVVTGEIERLTQTGVRLKSGEDVPADIIVTATGFELQMFGGAALLVDGRPVETGALCTYKGVMFSGVPNFASVFGYINTSWTLRAELVCAYVNRLLAHMDARGLTSVTPRPQRTLEAKPFVDFSSGYFERGAHVLPKQTGRGPWIQSQSYLRDVAALLLSPINDGALSFVRAPGTQATRHVRKRARGTGGFTSRAKSRARGATLANS